MSFLKFNNGAAPTTPASGKTEFFVPTSPKRLWYIDDTGASAQVGGTQGVFNVQDFGVLPSNSAATNVTNMNTLLQTTAPSGSTIYFPPGTPYQFNAALTQLTKGFAFVGVYGSSTIALTANIAGNFIRLSDTTSLAQTSFRGLQFFSQGVQQTSGATIECGNAIQVLIEDCLWSGGGGTNQLFTAISMIGTNSGNGAVINECNFGQCNGPVIVFSGGQGSSVVQNSLIVGTTVSGGPAVAGIQVTTASGVNGGSILIDNVDIIGCTNNLLINPVVSTTCASVFVSQSFFDQGVGASVKLSGAGTIARCRFVACWMTLSTLSSTANAVEVSTTGSSSHVGIEFEDCWILNTPAGGGSPVGVNITAASDISFSGCQIAGFTTGLAVTPVSPAGTTKIALIENSIGNVGGVGVNTTGVLLNAGAVTYGMIQIQDNAFDNTTNITDNSTGTTKGKWINNNPGFNPKSVVTQPAVPASTVAITNTTGVPVTVYIKGGTITVLTVGGVISGATFASTQTGVPVPLGVNQTIAITYSVAPTWVWIGS